MDADRRLPGARLQLSEGADRWLPSARMSSCGMHNPPLIRRMAELPPIRGEGDLRLKREAADPPPIRETADPRLKRKAADPPPMRETADPRLKRGSPDLRSSAVQLLFRTCFHR